jgi:hypothetical protein
VTSLWARMGEEGRKEWKSWFGLGAEEIVRSILLRRAN